MNTSIKCLACGTTDITLWASAKDSEYMTTDKTFQFYRCTDCHALSIDPVPADQLNIIYPSNYYSFASSKRSLISTVKNWLDQRTFKNILAKLHGESLRVLDVGGGAGSQLDILKNLDKRIKNTHIVDLDPNAEKLACEKGHQYFCGRIEDYSTDVKFDLILALNLIEHVAEPAHLLKKLQSVLAPNGIILIKTPNYDALDARLFRNANWGGYHCPRHWVLFTKKSFERLVSQAELKVSYFAYTQGAPFWSTSLLYWMSKKGLIEITKEKPALSHPMFKLLSAGFAAFDFIRRPFSKTSQMFFMLTSM